MRRGSFTFFSAFTFTALSVVAAIGGVILLVLESLPVWQHSGFSFATGKIWFFRQEQFGAAAMIYGSLVVALIAIVFAAPLGIGAAIFTAEFAPKRWRIGLKVFVELLAGIPSVVYGLLGVLLLRNWIYRLLEDFDLLSGDTLLTAGILLGVIILPTVMTLADDALSGVPDVQRKAARGLGMNSSETVLHISIAQATPGLLAAILLAIGRAMGETIAVFLIVGRQDNQWPERLLSWQPLLESGQTLTSKLGGAETNIAYGQDLHWAAIAGLGLLLLSLVSLITFAGLALQNFTRRHET